MVVGSPAAAAGPSVPAAIADAANRVCTLCACTSYVPDAARINAAATGTAITIRDVGLFEIDGSWRSLRAGIGRV